MDKARKKQLSQAYKLAFEAMGIYAVKNLATGRQLIGQSRNLPGILNRHRAELRLGSHRNTALMADWRLHGESGFEFLILEQLKERLEPDFDYAAELEQCLSAWQAQVPAGSAASYL